jgi:DNA-binding NarL/FixJ family response regulator
VRVLIADDHPVFRAGLRELLTKEPDVTEIGEAEDGQKALSLARSSPWDIVILDVTLPGKDGIDVLHDLHREKPQLPVLVLSAHPEDQLGLRLLKAGAAGYITKSHPLEDLVSAIRKVSRGGKYISEYLAEKTALHVISDAPPLPHEALSDREYQVMHMLASGKTIKEIGEALFLSTTTVSTYRARLLEKMGMKSNAELLRYAIEHKLLE